MKQALDMSMGEDPIAAETPSTRQTSSAAMPDFSMMSEEDQIAYAMQLSMAPSAAGTSGIMTNLSLFTWPLFC